MISGIGVDIELIDRFKKVSPEFLNFIFTQKEIEYCQKKKQPEISFAGKFCAKEAVIKAHHKKIPIKSIEIINLKSGQPVVFIDNKQNKNIQCSISHAGKYAIAFAVITKS